MQIHADTEKAQSRAASQEHSPHKRSPAFTDQRSEAAAQQKMQQLIAEHQGAQRGYTSAAPLVQLKAGGLVAQLTFNEKKKNNTIATRAVMKTHRSTEGLWNYSGCQKNFAINLDNTNQYGFSDEGGHSERNLLNFMFIDGRTAGDPINIHTERETCGSCYTHLKKLHDTASTPFDMNISYTVDYPGDGNSQENLYNYYNQLSDMPKKKG